MIPKFKVSDRLTIIAVPPTDDKRHGFKVGDKVKVTHIVPATDPAFTLYRCRLIENERVVWTIMENDAELILNA